MGEKQHFLKAEQRVPDHLRGTRQGLFHILTKAGADCAQTRPTQPTPPNQIAQATPATSRAMPTQPQVRPNIRGILQSDDFIFAD